MRKLQTQDLFNALRLIKKANLREEIKPLLKIAGEGNMSVEDVGIEGILYFIEILSEKKAENAIYEILAGPFETTAKDIEKMDLFELTENIEILLKENNIKCFFTLLAGLNKKNF